MHWLDQILATPVVGIATAPVFRTSGEIFAALRPILLRWHAEAIETTAEQPSPFAAKLNRHDGYTIEIQNDQIIGSFQYRASIKELPGELARLSFSTPTTALSTLLTKCVDLTFDTLNAISAGRELRRIGIVADCKLESSSVPPGVDALRNHLASPWNGSLEVANATLTAELAKDASVIDRCHHTLDFNELDRPKDTRLRLDWQRNWTKPALLKKGDRKPIDRCVTDAMSYLPSLLAEI